MEASLPGSVSPLPQKLAKASWICPLIILGLMTVSRGVASGRIFVDVAALVLALTGRLFGVVALFGIRRFGRKKILAPALTGILINGLLVLIWVTNFWAAYERARAGRHSAA